MIWIRNLDALTSFEVCDCVMQLNEEEWLLIVKDILGI